MFNFESFPNMSDNSNSKFGAWQNSPTYSFDLNPSKIPAKE